MKLLAGVIFSDDNGDDPVYAFGNDALLVAGQADN
jgi:hypothetical protein